ncbi:MAG: zinc-ribbon domain-containing protein [Firmicutes bacterium]|nr:zinc-ribbon domain-containing protein [Bacillota bacterium]
MSDKTITCKDCGNEFVFTEGEQQFYAEKGFNNDPVRCKDCRAARKAQRRPSNHRGASDNNGFNAPRISRF